MRAVIDTNILACRAPKNDKFLEVAVADRADVTVTSNGDFVSVLSSPSTT